MPKWGKISWQGYFSSIFKFTSPCHHNDVVFPASTQHPLATVYILRFALSQSLLSQTHFDTNFLGTQNSKSGFSYSIDTKMQIYVLPHPHLASSYIHFSSYHHKALCQGFFVMAKAKEGRMASMMDNRKHPSLRKLHCYYKLTTVTMRTQSVTVPYESSLSYHIDSVGCYTWFLEVSWRTII